MPGRINMPGKRHKFGAKRTVVDGISFQSKHEAKRYSELKLLEMSGDIRALEVRPQPKFELSVNGQHIANYFGDFRYFDCHTGKVVVEDAKGVKTEAYKLKKKLVKAIHGIEITEV